MTDFIITGSETTTQFLDDGESGVIAEGGSLIVIGGDAIEGDSLNSLQVAGTLAAHALYSYAEAFDFDGYVMLVNVTQTGSITGTGAAIDADVFDFASINNDGVITGFEDAIYISATDDLVTDPVSADSYFEISNQGSIIGGYSAITLELSSTTAAVIRNSGKIIADVRAIDVWVDSDASADTLPPAAGTGFFGGALELFNSGEITSSHGPAIWSTSGDDEIHNSGIINGSVRLAEGADLYDGDGGQVIGTVQGRFGADTLSGGALTDVFAGGKGKDTLEGRGGDDELRGNRGADLITGGRGDDTLKGGVGRDKLNGGRGDDDLKGGKGNDKFIFDLIAGNDVIDGFKNGQDKIDLTAFGYQKSQFDEILAAISKDGKNAVYIDLEALGGKGSIEVDGLKFSKVDASDFLI